MLANPDQHAILKQAVGSTRKSMTDLSYEVNDDFNPGNTTLILHEEETETGEGGSMQLITDVKKVEQAV